LVCSGFDLQTFRTTENDVCGAAFRTDLVLIILFLLPFRATKTVFSGYFEEEISSGVAEGTIGC